MCANIIYACICIDYLRRGGAKWVTEITHGWLGSGVEGKPNCHCEPFMPCEFGSGGTYYLFITYAKKINLSSLLGTEFRL